MNLQESIRRILREEREISPMIKRRLYIADEYMDNILKVGNIHNMWVISEIDQFVRGAMAAITRLILQSIGDMSENKYIELYDDIYEYLIKLGYQKKIFDFFHNTMMNRKKNK